MNARFKRPGKSGKRRIFLCDNNFHVIFWNWSLTFFFYSHFHPVEDGKFSELLSWYCYCENEYNKLWSKKRSRVSSFFFSFSRLVSCILLFIFLFFFLVFLFAFYALLGKCCHCRASCFKSVLHCMHSSFECEAFQEALHFIFFFSLSFAFCLDELYHFCRGITYKTIAFSIPGTQNAKKDQTKKRKRSWIIIMWFPFLALSQDKWLCIAS